MRIQVEIPSDVLSCVLSDLDRNQLVNCLDMHCVYALACFMEAESSKIDRHLGDLRLPPETCTAEELKLNTGFSNLMRTGMLRELVRTVDVASFTEGL